MNFDMNVIATGLLAPVVLLLVRVLLDFSLARWIVKYFWWVPVRSILRVKLVNISGVWEQKWGDAGSEGFRSELDRHSYTTIRQFGPYCYAEFYSKGVAYCIFGTLEGSYITGTWRDRDDENSYFGAFQLRVVDSKKLVGRFVGHSKTTAEVLQDEWVWTR
jgi:hypothetical protein